MKKFTENIIMIEPNRFTKSQYESIENQLGLPKNTISDLKSKNITKAWIWEKSGKVIFFREKNNTHIKHDKIKFNLNNIKTFKLNKISEEPILEINSILDKISKEGINSLTNSELEFLDKIEKVTKK